MAERIFNEETEKLCGMEWKLTTLTDKSVHLICQGPWTTQKYVFAEMSFKVFNVDRCKKHKVFSKEDSTFILPNHFTLKAIELLPLEQSVHYLNARSIEETEKLIKSKFSGNEISTPVLRASLLCPLSKCRIVWPCRPSKCDHIQPFDGKVFLELNKDAEEWTCPVCDNQFKHSDLLLDLYFQNILNDDQHNGVDEIILLANGDWKPYNHQKSKDIIDLEREDSKVADLEAEVIIDLETEDKDEIIILDDVTNKRKVSESINCVVIQKRRCCPSAELQAKAFKLYNNDRSMKKLVLTTGVQDLINKGKAKFGYPETQKVKVVMADDCETEIDDDESLLDLEKHTLLILLFAQ